MSAPLVILGTGLAGWTVAREFRKLDPQTPIVLVSRDEGAFYSKPMLSNALASGKTAESLVNQTPQAAAAGNPAAPSAEAVGEERVPTDIPELSRLLFRWARGQAGLKVLPAVERELVIEALKETQGNQVRAARLLGITRATLRKRVDKFGIRRELNVS